MKLSVVIPAHNEEGCIEDTVHSLANALREDCIDFDILVVNDNSQDGTRDILERLSRDMAEVGYIDTPFAKNGYGFAVRAGLQAFKGDAVAIVMADGSDDPQDVVRFFRRLEEGYDCVFGSRFMKGGGTVDYPKHKLILNRTVNTFIRLIFGFRYNDTTNAFKMYRRRTIDGLQPLMSHHFNLTVELPLKAVIRGYSYAVIPNTWTNRQRGVSKLKLREMGSRYLFIVLYCFIEKWLSRGDYLKDC